MEEELTWRDLRLSELEEIISSTDVNSEEHKAALEERRQLHSEKMDIERIEFEQYKVYTQAETEANKIAAGDRAGRRELAKVGALIAAELSAIGITLNFEKLGIIATKAWSKATSFIRFR